MLNMYYNPEIFKNLAADSAPGPADGENYDRHVIFRNMKNLMIVQLVISFFIAVSIMAGFFTSGLDVFTSWTDWTQLIMAACIFVFYLFVKPSGEADIGPAQKSFMYISACAVLFYGTATALCAHVAGRQSVEFIVGLSIAAIFTRLGKRHLAILVSAAGAVMVSGFFMLRPRQGVDLEMLVLNSAAAFIAIYASNETEKMERENYFQNITLEKQRTALSGINNELEVIIRSQMETIMRSEMLSRYLPIELVDRVLRGDVPEKKTEKLKLSVFFSDIKDFTKMSDTMAPEELARVLNEYMDEMTKIARKHGATLDKFVGDSIMIFFGAPEITDDRDHAIRCVKMAMEMQKKMVHLRKTWHWLGFEKPFEVRMGINTGVCIVGNFGSAERLSYTAIGKQVNIAARLEQACVPGSILLSGPTYELIKGDIKCRPPVKYALKGLAEEVIAYNPEIS